MKAILAALLLFASFSLSICKPVEETPIKNGKILNSENSGFMAPAVMPQDFGNSAMAMPYPTPIDDLKLVKLVRPAVMPQDYGIPDIEIPTSMPIDNAEDDIAFKPAVMPINVIKTDASKKVATKKTTRIPLEETQHYKDAKVKYYAEVAKFNATNPCKFVFCNDREECVNFPKCKPDEKCPRAKCVPRKLCKSTICPPGLECAEFPSHLGGAEEFMYPFEPMINYPGDSLGIRPTCISRKVPSAGGICGVNERLNNEPLAYSEITCSLGRRYGLIAQSDTETYCVCKDGFVHDDITGECIHYSKCPNFRATKSTTKAAKKIATSPRPRAPATDGNAKNRL